MQTYMVSVHDVHVCVETDAQRHTLSVNAPSDQSSGKDFHVLM